MRCVKNVDTSVSSNRITVPFTHFITFRLYRVKSARAVTLLVFIPGMLSSNLGRNSFEGFSCFFSSIVLNLLRDRNLPHFC